MAEYINKAAVVAEIDKQKKDYSYGSSSESKYRVETYQEILSFLDTLEVKEVLDEKPIKERGSNDMKKLKIYAKQGHVNESGISLHENKTCKENGDSLTQDDELKQILSSIRKIERNLNDE